MKRKKLAIDFLNILFFVFLVSIKFFTYNSYSFFSGEAIIFQLLFLSLLLVTYLVFIGFKYPWIFYGLMFAFFIDLICRFSIDIQSSIIVRFVVLFFVSSFISYYFKDYVPKIVRGGLSIMLVVTIVEAGVLNEHLVQVKVNNPVKKTTNKANILFFILDEHIGIEGIPDSNVTGANLKKELIQYYKKNGFELFGRVFSNYYDSMNSIPSILNYSLMDKSNIAIAYKISVIHNKLLQKLLKEGYSLNIYQSNYIDYCSDDDISYTKCVQYKNNSIGYPDKFKATLKATLKEKLWIICDSFVSAQKSNALIIIYEYFMRNITKFLNIKTPPRFKSGPIPSMQILDEIKKDLDLNRRGTLFFAHLLMPHYPYIYNENCKMRKIGDWEVREAKNDEEWEHKYKLYLAQTQCLHYTLSNIFEFMKEINLFDSSTIILIGDHGSRIVRWSSEEHFSSMTPRNMVDMFSTFIAIKNGGYRSDYPMNQGCYFPEKIPVARVVNDFFGLSSIEDNKVNKRFDRVYLTSEHSTNFFEHDMPDF